MSLAALVLCGLASAGVARDPPGDEGVMAHLYQLLIVTEIPIICAFVCLAVRRGLRRNLGVLAAQLALLGAALGAVARLGL